MHIGLLDILRCAFCGGHLELVTSHFHRADDTHISDGVIACECCTFPVVDGIPVMHLDAASSAARAQIEAGNTEAARLTMVGVTSADRGAAFMALAANPEATYTQIVDALGPDLEGGYFLYRFSDPTFVVAEAVVNAVASTVLGGHGRALDVCGGSGHITRVLAKHAESTVLADLFYAKLWLARRFMVPGIAAVCCDGNVPFPFARGAFDLAMCSDAFMYLWEKRAFVGELTRAVAGKPHGTVFINHTHNQLAWSPSHGQPLTPAGYRHLFETIPARVFGESAFFGDVVGGTSIDLGRVQSDEELAGEPALTVIASPVEAVYGSHALQTPTSSGGDWRVSPLYELTTDGDHVRGTLRFPDSDYEYEYGTCRAYLPNDVTVAHADLDALNQGEMVPAIADLIRRHVIVELPKKYS